MPIAAWLKAVGCAAVGKDFATRVAEPPFGGVREMIGDSVPMVKPPHATELGSALHPPPSLCYTHPLNRTFNRSV